MSPRGGKCARVSKVAAKGRQARGQRSGNVFPDPMEAEETTPATSPSASAMPTTMMAMLVVTSSGTAAVATTGADKPAASTAACCNDEGRSQWVERMRQPQESSSEPARENGTPVHPRHPERSRRRERHAAAATATATATAHRQRRRHRFLVLVDVIVLAVLVRVLASLDLAVVQQLVAATFLHLVVASERPASDQVVDAQSEEHPRAQR